MNYLKILNKATQRYSEKDYTEIKNKLFSDMYDEIYEVLSRESLAKLNNMFILLTGISLETLFESECVEELVENNYEELLERK